MSIFSENIKYLKTGKKITQDAMAKELIITRDRLAAYEVGRNEPPIELLKKISNYFHISIDILVTVDLNKVPPEKLMKLDNNRILFPITVDEDDKDQIEVVTIAATAGYLNGLSDPEYIESLQHMKLPFMPTGKHRAFLFKGDSMPPLQDGSCVVAKYIETLDEIDDGSTYIVVSMNDGLVFKKVYNKIAEDGSLHLHSTNKAYEPYTINAEEILEIWKFTCSINSNEPTDEEVDVDHIISYLSSLNANTNQDT